jgi:hypothetical protein
MKKIALALSLLLCVFLLTGCGGNTEGEPNIEGSLDEIMTKVTDGVGTEMALMTSPITEDTFKNYFFIDYIEGSEGFASDAAINAIPHSIALLRLPEGTDGAAVEEEIRQNLDPRKWICVEAEEAQVVRHGDLILVAMSDTASVTKAVENFDALAQG